MYVLGINYFRGLYPFAHDTGAALVCDGEIVAAVEQERFGRIKHCKSYPADAIDFCLRQANITIDQVGQVAIANCPSAFFRNWRLDHDPRSLSRRALLAAIAQYDRVKLSFQINKKVSFVEHHTAHAAVSFFTSGFEQANVLVIDGCGESESFTFFIGAENSLKPIWKIYVNRKTVNSIGRFYTHVGKHLNLGRDPAGKVMGLASYGNPVIDLSRMYSVKTHKECSIDRFQLNSQFGHLKRIHVSSAFSEEQKNLAASTQAALEQIVLNLACEAHSYSGIKNFVLSGGVALNCNANSKLLAQPYCQDLYIPPVANDSGNALGAALAISSRVSPIERNRLSHAYFGPQFDDWAIREILDQQQVKYRHIENIAQEAARLLCQAKIIGWFQGRMEIGPRALGNRSILADPALSEIKDRINIAVKERETWRPFGAAVIQEAAPQFFHGFDKVNESPFMLQTFKLRDEYRQRFPGITHIDNSSRLQTVNPDQNPLFYRLLQEIEKINGTPMVLNTSFNQSMEPIVCTPYDAVSCFLRSGLDYLAIGNFLVEK